jgi:hypothetical protein
MKRKWLFVAGSAVVLIVGFTARVFYLSRATFGGGGKKMCSNRVVESIPIGDGSSTVTVEDGMCDTGLTGTGSYRVTLRYRDHGRIAEKLLLSADNMRADSTAPRVQLLTPNELLISAKREMIFERGPADVAGIRLTYDLK